MIQLLLTLIGLLFPTNNTHQINNNQDIRTIQNTNPTDSDTAGIQFKFLLKNKKQSTL